ncbi:MAG: hypothetical protein PUB22_06685 [Clostridiales bacterium]|nr:hypothetical protein [Clostridiales bacterium]
MDMDYSLDPAFSRELIGTWAGVVEAAAHGIGLCVDGTGSDVGKK